MKFKMAVVAYRDVGTSSGMTPSSHIFVKFKGNNILHVMYTYYVSLFLKLQKVEGRQSPLLLENQTSK